MLVCNVSLRPPRAGIAAEIVEVGAALDAATTGNVVFATLVDDPASVGDLVDAYLGEIMLEAASAGDTADASIPAVLDAAIAETTTAASTEDATMAAPYTTWDPATVSVTTLSGGNLVATNTSAVSTGGAQGVVASGKATGKYYYEITITTLTGGGNYGVGVGTTTSTYVNLASNATTGAILFRSGNLYVNGSGPVASFGARSAGDVIGIAVDLINGKVWHRVAPSGNWNANASYDPATNTGGFTLPAGTYVPFWTNGGSGGATGNVATANFGASAFSGAVPSGFTSGWPT